MIKDFGRSIQKSYAHLFANEKLSEIGLTIISLVFYESNLPLANQFCQKPAKKPGTDFYFVETRYFREFCMHPLTFDSPKNKYKHKKVSENVSPMQSIFQMKIL